MLHLTDDIQNKVMIYLTLFTISEWRDSQIWKNSQGSGSCPPQWPIFLTVASGASGNVRITSKLN